MFLGGEIPLIRVGGVATKTGTTIFQKHHIIPNQVYKIFKYDLKKIGWKQHDIWNLKNYLFHFMEIIPHIITIL